MFRANTADLPGPAAATMNLPACQFLQASPRNLHKVICSVQVQIECELLLNAANAYAEIRNELGLFRNLNSQLMVR